jgi:hypothetical protein
MEQWNYRSDEDDYQKGTEIFQIVVRRDQSDIADNRFVGDENQ